MVSEDVRSGERALNIADNRATRMPANVKDLMTPDGTIVRMRNGSKMNIGNMDSVKRPKLLTADFSSQVRLCETEVEQQQQEQQRAEQDVRQCQQQLAGAEQRAASLDKRGKSIRRELNQLKRQLRTVKQKLQEHSQDVEADPQLLQDSIRKLQNEVNLLQPRIEEVAERIAKAEEQRDEAQRRQGELQREREAVNEKQEKYDKEFSQLEAGIAKVKAKLRKWEASIRKESLTLEDLEKKAKQAQDEVSQISAQLQTEYGERPAQNRRDTEAQVKKKYDKAARRLEKKQQDEKLIDLSEAKKNFDDADLAYKKKQLVQFRILRF